MSYPMEPRQQEVFDWAAYEPQQHAEVEPYHPAPLPAVIPPVARVVQPAFGSPYYAHVPPQPLPAYDPIPARRLATAALILSSCVGLSLVEVASWVMFKGLSIADHALMSLGLVLIGAAGLVFALKSGGSVNIKNFHQGPGATFRVGR